MAWLDRRAGALAGAIGTASLLLLPFAANAEQRASVTGSLTLLPTLSIRTNHDLVLGTILLAGAPKPEQHSSSHHGAQAATRREGVTKTNASFVIVGEPNQIVSLAVPSSIVMTLADGNRSIVVETVTHMSGDALSQLSGIKLNRKGVLIFSVRGQLVIESVDVPGRYSGMLAATAQYN